MPDEHPIFAEIRSLLDGNGGGRERLEQIEHTLTAGYASALALEAERWRIERRITQVSRMLDGPSPELEMKELAGLARRLADADEDLTELRGLLASLRTRANELRAA